VDRFRKPMGREKKRFWDVSFLGHALQPFSQKSLTATVPKVFQIGLDGVVVADLELFCNSWSVGFFGRTAVYANHFLNMFLSVCACTMRWFRAPQCHSEVRRPYYNLSNTCRKMR